MKYELKLGDCLDVLRAMPDCSVDSIVTDPPYGLSFMGKKWDYDVPSVEIWAECLRVLKPGGHLLAFAGTRTQHRMAVRIEDAGFEIRDMIAWVYGSGFPKSLDVSKAIDKMDASEEQERRRRRFTAWVRSTGITSRQIDEATCTNMGGHYTTAASQPATMTREHLEQCRHLLGDVPQWVEREADIRSVESKNFAKREVVSQQEMRDTSEVRIAVTANADQYDAGARRVVNITAPATSAAHQWQGWGTALKPALEPITVARKPFPGTVAANVLAHGTGGLNVDGCRVNPGERIPGGGNGKANNGGRFGAHETNGARAIVESHTSGRWPANLIHDGSDEVVAGFPVTKSAPFQRRGGTGNVWSGPITAQDGEQGYSDTGSAARFFYCAKASKADRDEGLEGFELKRGGSETFDSRTRDGVGAERQPTRANVHPTVKPTALMRYLCRLVTPPGGLVLDPFMGSGSTGKAAVLEGFEFIGIERDADYLEIATSRIQAAQDNKPLL